MKPVIFSLFTQTDLLQKIAGNLQFDVGKFIFREFPDQETYLKINEEVKGREVIIFDSLDSPNKKILPLLFLADTAKDLGAKRVGFVAPYLAYMRQDKRFNSGEAITSRAFAKLIVQHFDWLITTNPHLHRYHHLNEIYDIPCDVAQAENAISEWIIKHIEEPLLIGPDMESEQWVSTVAEKCKAPYVILQKNRHGDREVEISMLNMDLYKTKTPVLIDDIISTAQTMIITVKHLRDIGMKPAICIGVHAIFAGTAYVDLQNTGVTDIITCNTVQHITNRIDLSTILSNAIVKILSTKKGE